MGISPVSAGLLESHAASSPGTVWDARSRDGTRPQKHPSTGTAPVHRAARAPNHGHHWDPDGPQQHRDGGCEERPTKRPTPGAADPGRPMGGGGMGQMRSDAALSSAAPGHGAAWRQEEGTGKEGVVETEPEGEQEGNGQQQPRGPTVPVGFTPKRVWGREGLRGEQSSKWTSCGQDGGSGAPESTVLLLLPHGPHGQWDPNGAAPLPPPHGAQKEPLGGQSDPPGPTAQPRWRGGREVTLPPTHPGGPLSTQNCCHKTGPDAPSHGVTQQGQCQPAAPPYTPRNSPASAPTQLPPAPRCPQLIRGGREGAGGSNPPRAHLARLYPPTPRSAQH